MTDPTRPDDEVDRNGGPPDADVPASGAAPEDAHVTPGTADAAPTAPEPVAVAVTVTRTGGFAGLRRSWHAQPESADAPHWIALIDGCPWDDADPTRPIDPHGADRFLWHVDARCGEAAREAALADPEVRGPWRDLIDAVRSAQPDEPRKNRGR
jgi:hypothetical protein